MPLPDLHRRGHCIVKYSRGCFQRLQRRHCSGQGWHCRGNNQCLQCWLLPDDRRAVRAAGHRVVALEAEPKLLAQNGREL